MAADVKTGGTDSQKKSTKLGFRFYLFIVAVFAFIFFCFAFLPMWVEAFFFWIYYTSKKNRLKYYKKNKLESSIENEYVRRKRSGLKFILVFLLTSIILAGIWVLVFGWISFILLEVVSGVAIYLAVIISKKGNSRISRVISGFFNLDSYAGVKAEQKSDKEKTMSGKRRSRIKPRSGKMKSDSNV